MGVLRFVPKKEPLQFVAVKNPIPQSPVSIQSKELTIILGKATLRVPEGMESETLKHVISALRDR